MTYLLEYDGCTRLHADGLKRASYWLGERGDTVFVFHDCGSSRSDHAIMIYEEPYLNLRGCYDRVDATTGLSA